MAALSVARLKPSIGQQGKNTQTILRGFKTDQFSVALPAPLFDEAIAAIGGKEGFGQRVITLFAGLIEHQRGFDAVAIGAGQHRLPFDAAIGLQRADGRSPAAGSVITAVTSHSDPQHRQDDRTASKGQGHGVIVPHPTPLRLHMAVTPPGLRFLLLKQSLEQAAMDPSNPASPRSRRLRRWLIGIGVTALLLAIYGFSLNWFAQQLGDDLEKSIRLPSTAAERETSGGSY